MASVLYETSIKFDSFLTHRLNLMKEIEKSFATSLPLTKVVGWLKHLKLLQHYIQRTHLVPLWRNQRTFTMNFVLTPYKTSLKYCPLSQVSIFPSQLDVPRRRFSEWTSCQLTCGITCWRESGSYRNRHWKSFDGRGLLENRNPSHFN